MDRPVLGMRMVSADHGRDRAGVLVSTKVQIPDAVKLQTGESLV